MAEVVALPADVAHDLGRLATLVAAARPPDNGMADWLYDHWYTSQGDTAQTPFEGTRPDLCGALDLVCAASMRWRDGWVVLEAHPNGLCLVGSGETRRWVRPGGYASPLRPGLPPAPGDMLRVRELVSDLDETTGYWLTQSAGGPPQPPLARLYFNVGWAAIGPVLADLTGWLDASAMRYALKYPSAPAATYRVDTLVVYFERSRRDDIEAGASALARRHVDKLRPKTPPLTRRLGPGTACADDPGGGVSFGQSRCTALASAAATLVSLPQDAAIAVLAAALATSGIDPQRPWSEDGP